MLSSTGVWGKKRKHRSRTKKSEKHSSQGTFSHFGFRGKKNNFPGMASFPPKFVIEDLYMYEIHSIAYDWVKGIPSMF